MALRVLNNEAGFDARQDETHDFGKICFIPSLGLSCFGCCGHHFKDKATMERFFDSNKRELKRYLEEGKTHKAFMERERLLDPCGGCYSLIREKDAAGRDQYVCAVHPLRIGGEDVRPGYCDHDYLCKTAAIVNRMTDEERKLFYAFLKEQAFDSFEYSMINEQETVLHDMYLDWKEARERTAKRPR